MKLEIDLTQITIRSWQVVVTEAGGDTQHFIYLEAESQRDACIKAFQHLEGSYDKRVAAAPADSAGSEEDGDSGAGGAGGEPAGGVAPLAPGAP